MFCQNFVHVGLVNFFYMMECNATNDFSVFGKIGVFNWYGKNKGPYDQTKADGFAPSIGAGLTYQLSEAWQARVAYQYVYGLGDSSIGGTNANFTSIGISYQFGRSKPRTVTRTVIEQSAIILEEVSFALLFDFDKATIVQPDALQLVINRLIKYPQAKVSLRAYSDNKGSESYNLQLSKRRLDEVSRYLMANGVAENQIEAQYFGEQAPVIDNNSEEHRHLNRHLQIRLPQMIISPAQEKK